MFDYHIHISVEGAAPVFGHHPPVNPKQDKGLSCQLRPLRQGYPGPTPRRQPVLNAQLWMNSLCCRSGQTSSQLMAQQRHLRWHNAGSGEPLSCQADLSLWAGQICGLERLQGKPYATQSVAAAPPAETPASKAESDCRSAQPSGPTLLSVRSIACCEVTLDLVYRVGIHHGCWYHHHRYWYYGCMREHKPPTWWKDHGPFHFEAPDLNKIYTREGFHQWVLVSLLDGIVVLSLTEGVPNICVSS